MNIDMQKLLAYTKEELATYIIRYCFLVEACPRLKTWDILRDSHLFPFLLHRLLLISQGEIPC